jgi:hypothetical protein
MLAAIETFGVECDLPIIKKRQKILRITRDATLELRNFILQNPFPDERLEIQFFKEIKPRFCAEHLFHSHLMKIELSVPLEDPFRDKPFYLNQIDKLKRYFASNKDFCLYYRCGCTHLDELYFLRKNLDSHPIPDSSLLDKDPAFSTACDHKVSQFLSATRLLQYFRQQLNKERGILQESQANHKVSWTAPKVGLAELIYAFHASGVLNSSQMDIKSMSGFFSQAFNIEIGNIYKIFEEIRMRKKNRTVFLDSLRNNLLRRMNEDDEYAL